MTIDVDVLTESYAILKQYIPQKDRQEAADALMSILVDLLDDQSLKELANSDSALNRALVAYEVDDYEDETDDFDE
jgi:hypothetical protein